MHISKFGEKSNESHIYFTKRQANELKNKLGGDKIIVDYAMRYGNPSMPRLNILKESGCENIIILPLYPQYAAAKLQQFVIKFIDL